MLYLMQVKRQTSHGLSVTAYINSFQHKKTKYQILSGTVVTTTYSYKLTQLYSKTAS